MKWKKPFLKLCSVSVDKQKCLRLAFWIYWQIAKFSGVPTQHPFHNQTGWRLDGGTGFLFRFPGQVLQLPLSFH